MLWYALISCLQLRHSLLKFLGPKFPRENATSCNTFLALGLNLHSAGLPKLFVFFF
jgi:hypothetical protein